MQNLCAPDPYGDSGGLMFLLLILRQNSRQIFECFSYFAHNNTALMKKIYEYR